MVNIERGWIELLDDTHIRLLSVLCVLNCVSIVNVLLH